MSILRDGELLKAPSESAELDIQDCCIVKRWHRRARALIQERCSRDAPFEVDRPRRL